MFLRTPLWVRLVVGTSLLVTLAIALTGVFAVQLLRSYMLERIDAQLSVAAKPSRAPPPPPPQTSPHDHVPAPADVGVPPAPDGPKALLRPLRMFGMFYLVLLGPDGRQIRMVSEPTEHRRPKLPSLTATQVVMRESMPFTVPSVGGNGPRWRVLAAPLNNGNSRVVAASLRDVDSTVARLVRIVIGVGGAILVVMAAACHWLVRRSLRPLAEIERTAGAIAAGDLSRRVPVEHAGTETGRLGKAINGMLTQVERAFTDRKASETAARRAARAADESARAAQESALAARDSEDRMRRFVADASHELRTPLTSIRGFAELYRHQDSEGDTEAKRLLRRIEDEAKRMGLLVDDLLLLARLDRQRPIDSTPVDLLSLAAGAVLDARLLAPDRKIELVRLDGGEGALTVPGDEARLRQVVGNLVDNALRHTPPGTAFTVSVGVVGDGMVLEVCDQGRGFGTMDPEWVFERFYRADPSRTRGMGGGSGLGLSIVAALVQAHRGTVTAEHGPQGGALFRVVLPRRRIAPEAGRELWSG
ncbi:two-component system, OmpR family, sensor kinase [Sinosporangium album]|uniref:histidine kinase n=1 Tax=Sinosporangium album TaxID=504805 RepID=A0A1G8CMI4_9ACTN|nr:two-component system, OmpR family, sensor kinase [Sinosporangium album]